MKLIHYNLWRHIVHWHCILRPTIRSHYRRRSCVLIFCIEKNWLVLLGFFLLTWKQISKTTSWRDGCGFTMNGSIDQIINFLYTRLDSNQRFPFTFEIISNFISSVVLTDFLSKNMRKEQTESHSQVKLLHVFRQGHQCLNF